MAEGFHTDDEFSNKDQDARFFSDLTPAEQATLKSIGTPADIKSCEVLSSWRDDHLPCVGVRVNGVEFGIWWTDPQTYGAFEFFEVPRARQRVFDIVVEWITNHDEWCHLCGVHAALGVIAHKPDCRDREDQP